MELQTFFINMSKKKLFHQIK